MEIISCHTALSCCVVDSKGSLPPVLVGSGFTSSRYSHLHTSRLRKQRASAAVCSAKRYEDVTAGVLSETYDPFVLDGLNGLSGTREAIPKVSIPGLPDGDNVATINSCFWEWKPNFNVHYETSGSENVKSPPVLFLPGFGVGSFHYKKQLNDLGRDYRVWALDFLGQGMSLPNEDPTLQSKDGSQYVLPGQNDVWGFGDESETWADELVYSADLWRDQVHKFVEEVIKEPVYLVGNSLGGYMALYFAACNPQLVKGVTLLNATPVWGFLPNPLRAPRLSKLFPWAGTFPLPSGVRKLVQILWQKISDPTSIAKILEQVYKDHSTDVDDVFTRIVETTQHPAAAASFASIMFAPQAELSFKEALSRCQMNNTPICLAYGKDDPWVMPICGMQVKNQVPDAPYYEISPAGHCPHDEVPEVVNFLLRGWIRSLESGGSVVLPLLDDSQSLGFEVTKDLEFSRGGPNKLVRVQFHGSNYSLWSWLNSQFKPLFRRLLAQPSL
ncbi:pheophytinase, chloroplastic [Salvia hispanica]|uniref:pheophytinase, chloroplastic n=1 Tax=Salvia hispanica TaxID=49212 RepID=UPI00200936E5|nr:pheophytinase, chloroplastic [Salvia hispanica]